MGNEAEYEPFGKDWRKMMVRRSKEFIVNLLGDLIQKKNSLIAEKDAEIQKLKDEITTDTVIHYAGDLEEIERLKNANHPECRPAMERLEAQLKAAQEVIHKYAEHTEYCDLIHGFKSCACGLSEALRGEA